MMDVIGANEPTPRAPRARSQRAQEQTSGLAMQQVFSTPVTPPHGRRGRRPGPPESAPRTAATPADSSHVVAGTPKAALGRRNESIGVTGIFGNYELIGERGGRGAAAPRSTRPSGPTGSTPRQPTGGAAGGPSGYTSATAGGGGGYTPYPPSSDSRYLSETPLYGDGYAESRDYAMDLDAAEGDHPMYYRDVAVQGRLRPDGGRPAGGLDEADEEEEEVAGHLIGAYGGGGERPGRTWEPTTPSGLNFPSVEAAAAPEANAGGATHAGPPFHRNILSWDHSQPARHDDWDGDRRGGKRHFAPRAGVPLFAPAVEGGVASPALPRARGSMAHSGGSGDGYTTPNLPPSSAGGDARDWSRPSPATSWDAAAGVEARRYSGGNTAVGANLPPFPALPSMGYNAERRASGKRHIRGPGDAFPLADLSPPSAPPAPLRGRLRDPPRVRNDEHMPTAGIVARRPTASSNAITNEASPWPFGISDMRPGKEVLTSKIA